MSNIEKVNEFLTKAQTFYLTTVDGDKPKCRPVAFHMVANGNLYFGVGDFKDVYKQMQVNPNVEFCATAEKEFLRFYGKVVFESDNTIANAVLEKVPAMKQIYNDQTGYNLGIFHLVSATAEFRTMMGVKEKWNFKFNGRSVVRASAIKFKYCFMAAKTAQFHAYIHSDHNKLIEMFKASSQYLPLKNQ